MAASPTQVTKPAPCPGIRFSQGVPTAIKARVPAPRHG